MHNLRSATTAIRSRMMKAAQNSEKGRGVNRWVVYKHLCIAKSKYGLNDRSLAVLSALVSFFPEDEIMASKGMVVFPSNKQLSLRAHGMPESTLRRHLAVLVNAGIIERKDSPTRKRYAHKDKEGQIELAFGFSVEPLIQKAHEIAQAATQITSDIQEMKRLRDEVSVARRTITTSFESIDQSCLLSNLEALYSQFRAIVDTIPRRSSLAQLQAIKTQFSAIHNELHNVLKTNDNTKEMSAADAQTERHHKESLTESHFKDYKIQKNDILTSKASSKEPIDGKKLLTSMPLQSILHACPDIVQYATSGIRNWKDLLDTSHLVSKFLGISQQLWLSAIQTLGFENAGAVVAWLLQKRSYIKSSDGYLNSLIQKARVGEFSVKSLMSSY